MSLPPNESPEPAAVGAVRPAVAEEIIPCLHQETSYEQSSSEGPVLVRCRLAGFEVTGESGDQRVEREAAGDGLG